LYNFGLQPGTIREGLASFPGIAHRLEFVREARGLLWYNDSAATIPEAAAAAVNSFEKPVHLIAGGTDKKLEFEPLAGAAADTASISLLAGTATDKIIKLFRDRGIAFDGPFSSLEAAVQNVLDKAGGGASAGGSSGYAVLSPGCASFGMFRNEFDRGDQFRELIRSL
jgi:UDP-N-acetylmuramoylalanine--D-glutamate ligase